MNNTLPRTGYVIIGRNEGSRLKACLRSIQNISQDAVYVDSYSTDGSVLIAQSLGFRILELTPSGGPINASRARNAGFETIQKLFPDLEYVQFIDGDCTLHQGWIKTAQNWLSSHPETVAVCGRRRERSTKRSVYNRLCDIEWNTPTGRVDSFGGDVMLRAKAFASCGGYNETFSSGEEPDLSLRLRNQGGVIERLPAEMTLHDAGIYRFHVWVKRMIRGGYGARLVSRAWQGKVPSAQVPFAFLTRSTILWTDGWLLGAVFLTLAGKAFLGTPGVWIAAASSIGVWLTQAVRSTRSLRDRISARDAFLYGLFTMIGKWPLRVGQVLHWWDSRQLRQARNIRYKL